MIMQVYAVFDSAVGAHLPPFYARAQGEAIRAFTEAANDGKSPFFAHPLDYTLVYLGEWDDAGATFNVSAPVRVVSAVECRQEPPIPAARGFGFGLSGEASESVPPRGVAPTDLGNGRVFAR